jgi:hypothetical protein
LPIHFALRWLLLQPCWRLQRLPLLLLPNRLLCRLSLLRWLSPLQLPMSRPLLLPQRPSLQLRRWPALFRWLLSLLRWRRWQPLWLLQLWSLLWPQLPELRLVLFQLLSVALVLQAYPKRLLLWPVRFALRWLMLLPWLPLQQQLSMSLPDRPLCRLLWSRYSLLLWSQRWLRLLLQLLPLWQLQRWLARFRWLQWLLRWLRWPRLSLQ